MNYLEGFQKILAIKFPGKDETIGARVETWTKEFQENKNAILRGEIPEGPVRLSISHLYTKSGRLASLVKKIRPALGAFNYPELLDWRQIKPLIYGIFQKHGAGYEAWEKNAALFFQLVHDLKPRLRQVPEQQRLEFFKTELDTILDEAKMGLKGRNNVLRDCGYFDKIPIDVHEKRLLLRTGIFHQYADPEASDPLVEENLIMAMEKFCAAELEALEIDGIPLSKTPGLLDLIIWYYSEDRTEQSNLKICALVPLCSRCPLSSLCYYSQNHKS